MKTATIPFSRAETAIYRYCKAFGCQPHQITNLPLAEVVRWAAVDEWFEKVKEGGNCIPRKTSLLTVEGDKQFKKQEQCLLSAARQGKRIRSFKAA